MESSSEMIALPRPPSKKWVTFDDLVDSDDAMESGKRRATAKGDRRHSSSVSSSSGGSFDLADGGSCNATTTTTASPVDFSQSLGTGENTMAAGHKFFGSPTAAHASGSDPSMDKYTAAFSGAQARISITFSLRLGSVQETC